MVVTKNKERLNFGSPHNKSMVSYFSFVMGIFDWPSQEKNNQALENIKFDMLYRYRLQE
jgi:hypothetical protein